MNWIYDQNPPLAVQVLVQYKDTVYGKGAYDVLDFQEDREYGICAATYEDYVLPSDIQKWCLIT